MTVCAGDSYGRRITLLISVLLITLPTLLIGCLPTYKMIGLAAPVLMALLRFIQGIAVGGEVSRAGEMVLANALHTTLPYA